MRSVIIGAGKYGAVYLSYLKDAGIEIVGFLDLYRDCEVVRAYPHNGDTVLEVASVNG